MSTVLNATMRESRPRSLRNSLRGKDQVLGAVQGEDSGDVLISLDGKDLEKKLRTNGKNTVYTMNLNNKEFPVLLFEEQKTTFSRKWLHVDFLAVDLTEKSELEAEIKIVGTPVGVKENGGALQQNLYSVIVSAIPDKIPESITVDVSNLAIGDAITLADLPPHPDFEIIGDKTEQIAAVE